MRGRWLGRLLGGDEDTELLERLEAAANEGDWEAVLTQARRGLKRRPDDLDLLVMAARACLEEEGDGYQAEATAWLDQALALAADHRDALFLRGVIAWQTGDQEAAAGLWRRALAAAPDDQEVGEALTKLWVEAGTLPDWGVPVVESALLRGE